MKRLIDSLCGLLGRAGRAARALSLAGAALAIAVPASAGETVTHINNDPFGTPVMATDAAGNTRSRVRFLTLLRTLVRFEPLSRMVESRCKERAMGLTSRLSLNRTAGAVA
jgi:hypothetical protein